MSGKKKSARHKMLNRREKNTELRKENWLSRKVHQSAKQSPRKKNCPNRLIGTTLGVMQEKREKQNE